MPEASYYILPDDTEHKRYLFACKLVEKAYRMKQFCYIYTDGFDQSRKIDDMLWVFRAGSFIPHQLYDDKSPNFEQMVLIGSVSPPQKWRKLIVNLSSRIPEFSPVNERIVEIVNNNPQIKQAGRVRYKQYDQAGFNLSTHHIN